MENLFQKLNNTLVQACNPIVNHFTEPVDEIHIIELFKRLNLPPHQDLIALLSSGLGIDGTLFYNRTFNKSLYSDANILNFGSLVSLYLLDKSTNKIYKKKWFPIILFKTGDTILFNLDIKSNLYGHLFIFAPAITLSSSPVSIYDSITTWLETVIRCYESDVYTVKEDGSLSIDALKEWNISKELNPGSIFWGNS